MRKERRRQTPAAYGADYTRNLRWRYRSEYGEGSRQEPYRGGGSFGRGYGRARYLGPHNPTTPAGPEYRFERRRPRRWPGTAARDYDRAYPYFGSAAAVESAQGYPPGDTLVPESYPARVWRRPPGYDGEYQ
jgi:hypothetical protein